MEPILTEIYIASDALQLILPEVEDKDQGLVGVGYFDDITHRRGDAKQIQKGFFTDTGSYTTVQLQPGIRNAEVDHQILLLAPVELDAVLSAGKMVDGVDAGVIMNILERFFLQGKQPGVVLL